MRLLQSRPVSLAVCTVTAVAMLAACSQEPTPDEALNVSGTANGSTATTTTGDTAKRGIAGGLSNDEQDSSTQRTPSAGGGQQSPTTEDSRSDAAANSALVLTEVRIGEHQGNDRVVFEFAGEGSPGYMISYVTSPAQQGSGNPIDVPGSTFLQVMMTGQTIPMEGAAQEIERGLVTSPDAPTVKGVYFAGQFEGMGQSVIGLDSKRPYTAFTLDSPPRLVVDLQK